MAIAWEYWNLGYQLIFLFYRFMAQNLVKLAQQGDTKAISTLVHEWLGLPDVNAIAKLKHDCLQVMLESPEVPQQQSVVPMIRDGLKTLSLESVTKVKIAGRETGEDFPDWQEEFQLETAIIPSNHDNQVSTQETSLFGSVLGAIGGVANATGGAMVQAGQAVHRTAVGVGEAIGGAGMQTSQVAGQVLGIVGNNPVLKAGIKSLNQDWLHPLIDNIDIEKAQTVVKKLQQEHPNDKPEEIAHHLMLEKAVLAGGTGLTSSLAPGQAAAMFAVDWVATAALSVELVYQIAAAYGMDLENPERKGEAIAIFGLGVGGKTAIKAGLGLLRNLPVAGAVIGASSNAVMIYALGYAACQFYQAKENPLTLEASLVDAQIKSEKYLEAAISQEKIMDQILVHVVLAGNPDKSGEDILPELQTANLSPESLKAIATHIKSPPPLETLLEQINGNFAVSLLAQCQKIAQLDGVITQEEAQVLALINAKLSVVPD
ncbi:MAG: hypothetical protein QNJ36_21325 [Calothrix sp. MO_167.B42]|nr:hypothetical protein [Calothrix sp. MO_167.B42]